MAPALRQGDLALVRRRRRSHSLRRGAVVLVRGAAGRRRESLKRIVGLPGETVAISSGDLYVDARRVEERYVALGSAEDWGPLRLGDAEYLVLGDNRARSTDSRSWGPVRARDVLGTVALVVRTGS